MGFDKKKFSNFP